MLVIASMLAAAAVAAACLPGAGNAHRLAALQSSPRQRRPELGAAAACWACGLAIGSIVGWPAGLLPAAAVIAGGPRLLGRLEPSRARREREQLISDLPLVLDLLGACLAGGAPLPGAAAAVALAVPGPCGERLQAVVAALTVGTAPADAWLALGGQGGEDPLLPIARLLSRAVDGGTPLSAAMQRMAAEARAVSRDSGEAAARRVGVLIVAPLGLCFLPAFVLLGIVPVVAGLAAPLLASF
jgi:pilus assembly protein TadC